MRYGKVVTDCSRQGEVRIVGPPEVGAGGQSPLVEVLGFQVADLIIRKVPSRRTPLARYLLPSLGAECRTKRLRYLGGIQGSP